MNSPQDRQNFVRSVKLAIPPTPQDRKDFVCSVELAIPPTPPSAEGSAVVAAQADDEETASVVDSSAISFVGNLSAQQKSDVINSTLFAQWAANSQFNRNKEPTKWYDVYTSTLEKVGWTVQAMSFMELPNASTYGTVDKAVLRVMETFLTPALVEPFRAMIEALDKPDAERAYSIFKKRSWEQTMADFQSGVCILGNGNNVKWRIACYDYQASGFDGNVLFFKFGSSSVTFQYNTQDMVLDEKKYSTVRQDIVESLGANAKDYVMNVPLSPPQ
ncbi:uncharacterized protein LAESUDRAFT_728748 [Laetiporus sulphureus 93-53]|uniref:Uncharacterized protein n=1 Tax=Laetiporus sulphureus 93-53 TaxID=1314785 RepID=A0A165CYC3_9APHY|nr:uncharacterized protein LAESUDRAFT_728748 [Laetiporus sulphureus 93-53]KZT03738.1 hypothetical protein LAESUDRAFT_728748 [Laetiporus sulphureus 93-53]